jgi:hypothetical protein
MTNLCISEGNSLPSLGFYAAVNENCSILVLRNFGGAQSRKSPRINRGRKNTGTDGLLTRQQDTWAGRVFGQVQDELRTFIVRSVRSNPNGRLGRRASAPDIAPFASNPDPCETIFPERMRFVELGLHEVVSCMVDIAPFPGLLISDPGLAIPCAKGVAASN